MNLETRIEKAEDALQPGGEQYITINIVYDETVVDPITDERRVVTLPAPYDPNVPYKDWGNGLHVGTRYPLEDNVDPSSAND